MNVEENDQIMYTRVGPEQMRKFINKTVAIVGKVMGPSAAKRVTLDIGNDTQLLVENIDFDDKHPVPVLEVRGRLINDHTLRAEGWNAFSSEGFEFDLETFNKMLEHYHSQEYSGMTLN